MLNRFSDGYDRGPVTEWNHRGRMGLGGRLLHPRTNGTDLPAHVDVARLRLPRSASAHFGQGEDVHQVGHRSIQHQSTAGRSTAI